MNVWIINVLCVFVLSMILAGFIIPKILVISYRKKLFDDVDGRKIHKGAIPRLGGLAFSPVVFFSIALILGINIACKTNGIVTHLSEVTGELIFESCGLLMLYLIGMADDLIGVRYSVKFAVQILCGILLVSGGVWIDDLHGLLGIHALPEAAGYALTILIVVFFTNAVNLIDGLDGLASGLSIAALAVYGVSFMISGWHIYSAIAIAFMGVLLPFYYFNVFGNAAREKKIFMGDTGSLTLGFALSFLSIRLLSCAGADVAGPPNPFVLAFAPMLIPCLDVVRVFFRRIRHHKSPFLPDRTHIHHKLMAIGFSSHVAMLAIVGASMLLTAVNVGLSKYIDINILVIANLCLWILLNRRMSQCIQRRHPDSPFNG